MGDGGITGAWMKDLPLFRNSPQGGPLHVLCTLIVPVAVCVVT